MLLNCGVGEDSWESLVCKELKPVNAKGNQSWIFIGRTDAEAETPILWPPYAKNGLIWKDPDAVKDWRQEEKGMTEDEMVGLHHWLDGNEFEHALAVGDGQGSLVYCSPWGHKESDMTEWLNWTELIDMKGFSDSSVGKESAYNIEDLGLIPWSGRWPEKGSATHFRFPGLPLWLSW